MKKRINLYIEKEVWEDVKRQAKTVKTSTNKVAVEIIKSGLAKMKNKNKGLLERMLS